MNQALAPHNKHMDELAITFAKSKAERALEYSDSIRKLLDELQKADNPQDQLRVLKNVQSVQREMHISLRAAVDALKRLKGSDLP